MNRPYRTSRQQRGAAAIVVAISIGLLILMVGLVVDLGYLYTRKTELQNAADAAALAGAKRLNGTATGIVAAKDRAVELAAANSVDFGGNAIAISENEVEFGPGPDGPWSTFAISSASDTAAADKRFIKVDTTGIALSTIQTWFARVFQWGFGSIETTSTFGRAVAGPDLVDLLPIAACALDGSTAPPCSTTNCGYELGKAYKLSAVNPIGPGTFYWINPVTTSGGEAQAANACQGTGSTSFTLPFMCQGKVAAPVAAAPQVLTNSGISTPQLAALDSRFDDYPSQANCDPATAPPDTNIKQYSFDDLDVAGWMSPAPRDYVSPSFVSPGPPADDGKCKASQGECQASRVVSKVGNVITTDYGGVVWSFVRPQGDIPADTAGTPDVGRSPTASYPGTGTPYSQTSGIFFAPPTRTGKPGRRILTLLIVSCPASGGNCNPTNVVSRGRFLMQRKAISGGDNDIYIEFGGLVGTAGITADYKLYR
jgi:hypothetical protein